MSSKPPPGVHHDEPKRFLPRYHYELLACGVKGHQLLGIDARRIEPADSLVAREIDGVRFHRCLRCDSWLPVAAPAEPERETLPTRDEVDLPLRGKPLRDLILLRLIAINRLLHFLVLGAVSILVFAFASHQELVRTTFFRVVADFSPGSSTDGGHESRAIEELRHVFSLAPSTLRLAGAIFAVYAIVELVEAYGLWYQRRWAEYLTFLVTTSLLPLEIYELTRRLSPMKFVTLTINLAVVAYLLWDKRLFGVRGGVAAEEAERAEDVGWGALERSAPPAAQLP